MVRLVIEAAPIFSDNMVLQHGKPVFIWGSANPGSDVHVVWESGGTRTEAVTKVQIADWKWSLTLPPLPAGQQGELVISDEWDEIRFRNVITGDVWFAGGQSNMEMELVNCKNGTAELSACANPNIRFYQVVKRAVLDSDFFHEEKQSKWRVCAPETAAMLSAAAYFFARKINTDLGVPVGIINCSWGGTSISAWMSREQLLKSSAGKKFIDDYAAKVGGKSDAQYNAEMEDYFAQWRQWDGRIRAWREKEPDASWETLNRECGLCPWPQPAGNTSPYCPTNLYTSMVHRVAPFTLKGFLYYQGEEDADCRAADYREMMYYLVKQWRDDWRYVPRPHLMDHKFIDTGTPFDRLPFLFVQLPMYASREEMDSGCTPRHWCVMRENQYLASLDIAGTGMAVIIDCGEFDNIHPFDKQTVGFRLALQAQKKVYGMDIEADGPIFSWAHNEGGSLRLHFENAQSGLELRGETVSFEIAGERGPYFPASAVIDSSDVILSSDKVDMPRRARYAWVKFGATPLYAKNGLPAMPFRTNMNESAEEN